MASFHNAVLVGGDEKRFSVSNSPFLICVQTLFLSITTFVSCCSPNVKWEEGVGAVRTFTRVYKHWGFFLKIKILLWNQPNISEVNIFATVSEMSNVQKEKKKILCAWTLVPLHFPVPNIHPVTTSFKPIHAACNGSLTR